MSSRWTLFVAFTATASALQISCAGTTSPVLALRGRRAVAPRLDVAEVDECLAEATTEDEAAACMETADPQTIFSLQDRDDGWNDVRAKIKAAIKDREKPYNDIKDNYIAPASENLKKAGKWAKVLAEEVPGVAIATKAAASAASSTAASAVSNAKLKAPTLKAPTVETKPLKDVAIGGLASILDAAAASRQAELAKKATPAPKKSEPAPAAALTIFLVAGVPVVTLTLLALLATNNL